ncbi:hypothetical protein N9K06_01815 [Omnitrophica bacterium]|nr:hypothetical protein [Candidatus Omnitrophota bacterium]
MLKGFGVVFICVLMSGQLGCSRKEPFGYDLPPALRPQKGMLTVPANETSLPYTSLPDNGFGSFE